MGKHRCAAVAVGLLVAGSLVGCGNTASTSQPGGSVSASPTSSTSPTPEPTPTAGDSPSLSVSPSGRPTPSSTFTGSKHTGQMTIRGEIQEGVEAGCMLLKADDGKAYLLLGGDRALINSGGRLEAVGQLQPGLMTTCQQGTPFQVAQLRRI